MARLLLVALLMVYIAHVPSALSQGPDCESASEYGYCLADIPRYFFNKEEKRCEKFDFSGCGGNGNNYLSLAQCNSKCNPLALEKSESAPKPEPVVEPPKPKEPAAEPPKPKEPAVKSQKKPAVLPPKPKKLVTPQLGINQKYIPYPTGEIIVVSKESTMVGQAKCDGVDDDIEINQAIADTPSTITLSDGVFTISNQIVMKDNLIIQGQGMDKTIIKLMDNAPKWKQAGLFQGKYVRNVVIQHLTIDGNRHNQPPNVNKTNYGKYGFYCQACDNILMQYMGVYRFVEYGLDPHGEAGTARPSTRFTAQHNIVEDNGTDGITIDKTYDAYVYNNTVRHNLRHGIQVVTGAKHVRIFANFVEDNGKTTYWKMNGCGITMNNQVNAGRQWGTSNVTMIGNTVRGSLKHAICVNKSDDVKLINNTLSTNTESCGTWNSANHGVVEGNSCNAGFFVTGTYDKDSFKIGADQVVTYTD